MEGGGRDDDLVQAYVREHERRGLSPITVRSRVHTLRLFARWLAPRQLSQATHEDVQAWLDSRHVTPKSRTLYLSNVICFYRFCVREGFLEHDPTTRIVRPRLPRALPRPIATAALDIALAFADPRMRAWLCLAAYAGLRRKEIAGLRREHILDDRDPPMIHVVEGKGDRERLIPLNPIAWEALRAAGLPRRGYLWQGQRGPLQPNTIGSAISEYLHGLGIEATAHRLRHWFGSEVYSLTKDLRATQELLGHASPNTTAIYTAWSLGPASEAVLELGRKAKDSALDAPE